MVSESHLKIKINQISSQSFINLDLIISLILFLLAFIVYLKHLAPTIFTGDSADATIASYVLGIPHPPGFPVYLWIGHLFTLIPVGDIGFRVNLMSAFFGALVISIVYLIIRLFEPKSKNGFDLFTSRCGAIFGSMALAFSIYFWANAEIAEVNTLNAFLLALMILLVFIWAEKRDTRLLYLLSLLFSLSVGVSAANILFIPSFLVFLFLVDRKTLLNKKTLFAMIGIFIAIGLFQLLFLYIRALQEPGHMYADIRNIDAFLNYITAREYSSLPFSVPLSQGMGIYLTYIIRNVSLIGVLIGVIGIVLSLKKNILWTAFLTSLFAINILFFIQYDSFDLYDKLIPSFMMFSIFIGLCIWQVLGLIKPVSDNQLALKTGKKRSKPALKTGRREYFFNLFLIALVLIVAAYIPLNSYISHSQEVDRSGSIDLPYFLAYVIKEVPVNSTIIDMWQISVPLAYFHKVYNMNPSVEILGANYAEWPALVHERINYRDVFLVRKNQYLSNNFSIIPVLNMPGVGTLYKVYSGNPSFSVIDPVIQHRVNKLFGGNLELIGYNLNQSEEKDGFSLTSYWQSKENVSNDYIIGLDLIDQHGNVILEDIHTPIYGIFPSSQWVKNEILEERYNIIYPPTIEPGTYKLFMSGKWKTDSSNPSDKILLGNIEVGKIDLGNTLTRDSRDT
jgi:hypothetical protein